MSASKQKGTGGENEVVKLFNEEGIMGLLRTSPGVNYDITRVGQEPSLQLLATRPDRGRWLVTLDARKFARLLHAADTLSDVLEHPVYPRLEIEVKRYRRFSLHSIFESKFSR